MQAGATLTINGGSLAGNSVTKGVGGLAGQNDGSAFGAGIYLQGDENLTFASLSGQTTFIGDTITDETGAQGGGVGATGKAALTLNGPGKLDLAVANSFYGGVAVDQGTLEIGAVKSVPGPIAFAANGGGALLIVASVGGAGFYENIKGFDASSSLDFAGLDPKTTTATWYPSSGGLLYVASGATNYAFKFNYLDPFSGQPFYVTSDGKTGALVSRRAPPNHAPSGADETVALNENGGYTLSRSDFGFSDPNDNPPNVLAAVEISALPKGTLTDNGVAVVAGQFVSAAGIAAGDLVYRPDLLGFGAAYASLAFYVQDNRGSAKGRTDNDSTAHVLTFNVNQVVHQPQIVSGASNASSYVLGGPPVALEPALLIADAVYPALSQASVTVAAGLASGDQLTINGQTTGVIGAIQFQYDANAGVLTFSGQAALADYQAALRLVAYASSAAAQPPGGLSSRSFSLSLTSADPLAGKTSLASGPTITLAVDVAYFLAHKTALYALPAITITDNWSNVAAQLDALNDAAAVSSIKLTDPAAPPLSLGAAQAVKDVRALKLLKATWPVALTIADTASALETFAASPLSTLQALKAANYSNGMTATWTWNADGSHRVDTTDVQGRP